MKELLESLRELTFWSVVLRLALSVLCGGAIGFGRERQGRAAGLRTHVLVCLGSALTVLIGCFATERLHMDTDPLRIAAQVVSGIGFLGVGTILVTGKFHVTGLTTAAGLWTTAAIGLSAGIGFYEGALVCTLLAIMTTMLLSKLENRMLQRPRRLMLYLELESVECLPAFRQYAGSTYDLQAMSVTPPRSAAENKVGIELSINTHRALLAETVICALQDRQDVIFVIENH